MQTRSRSAKVKRNDPPISPVKNELEQLLELVDEADPDSIDYELLKISLWLKKAIDRLEDETPSLGIGLWLSFIAKDYYDELCRAADCEDSQNMELE